MNKNERGGIITLFALVLGLAVMVAALVVDHGKEELTVENLQRSADAAALAGARSLNGRIDGWRESKKAAMHAIRRNSVHSVGATTLSGLRLTDGPASYWDTHDSEIPSATTSAPALHRGTRGSAGEIEVEFERGTLWADPDQEGKFRFRSLEEAESGVSHYTSAYMLANAVRARITLRSLPTSFARIFGVGSFDTLTREAIAVSDAELVKPVLPIAIPSCVLNHNRNPWVTTGSHINPHFDVAMACEGRMIASFTNARGDLAINLPGRSADIDLPEVSRRLLDDGFERLEAQIPRPYPSRPFMPGEANVCFDANTLSTPTWAHNCKASIRYAYLGVPSSQARQSANEHEVVNAISNRPSATVGMYFKPLNDLFSLRTDVAASEAIAQAFERSTTKFANVFLVGGRPARNYPYLRTGRPILPGLDPQGRPPIGGIGAQNYDVRRNYPSNGMNAWGQENIEKILMGKMDEQGGMGQLNYTLPMCNWRSVQPNNPNNGVITGYAMVIDPGVDGAPYCDHRYDGQRKEAVAAVPGSEPIITGFVKVVLSGGFNFVDYRITNPPPPPGSPGLNPSITNTVAIPAFPTTSGVYYDDNIAYLDTEGTEELTDLKNRSSQYSEEFLQHVECVGDTGGQCGDNRPSTSELRPDFPADLERCFDFRGLKVQLAVITNQLNTTTPTRVCREITSCSDPGPDPLCPCPRWEYSSGDRNIIDQMLSNLNQLWEQPIRANPFTSCGRPVVTGATDLNNHASYGAWRPLEAGAGCNGFDMSLSCDGSVVSLATGKDWMDNAPALISEE